MDRQAEYAAKKRKACREAFLEKMDGLMDSPPILAKPFKWMKNTNTMLPADQRAKESLSN